MRGVDWSHAQPAAGRNGGEGGKEGGRYSLSGPPSRPILPGTKAPAGIALKVTEPRKLHHHVKVTTMVKFAFIA